ncbi:MAG TPA: alpha-2-macroglobulin family protein, partial [Thermoguttaceae bacterium]|nr:alpha-2-macroglobulin family protein [Thermoguttaceae bacterium]
KVLEKTTVQGKVGERLVEEHKLQTAKEDGTVRQTLMLDIGGDYVVRVEGTDRFDNPISGQHTVKISDEKDKVRLRILADTHTYKVGDTAKVKVHWREQPGLALVTLQGARVLDYRLVELQQGPNVLDIPMVARLAPNFELAVAAMTDNRKADADPVAMTRFHEASSPFTVQRDLRVTISTKRKDDDKGPVRPGEQIEVIVTTTDPQGKPVAAELSLAMVEQTLLERFPWQVASIRDFFRGTNRQSAVRTTSSITFAYNPSTRPINPRLLAERDRLEVAREEEEILGVAVSGGNNPYSSTASDDPFGSHSDSTEAGFMAALSDVDHASIPFDGITRQSNRPEQQQAIASGGMGGGMGGMGGGAFGVNRGAQLGRQFHRIAGPGPANGVPVDAGSTLSLDANGDGSFFYAPTNAGDLVQLQAGQVLVLNGHGSMEAFNLPGAADWNIETSQALVEELTRAGAVLLPGLTRQETGYWNPAVTTGDDGRATVTFTVPERSTAWTLMARGITSDTLAGEATDELVVKKDLFGQLKLPLAFTDGDKAQVTASVHNDAIDKGRIEVTLKTTIAGRSVEDHKTIDVTERGIREIVFEVPLNRPEQPEGGAAGEVNVAFELTVAAEAAGKAVGNLAGGIGDVVRRTVPLKPYGMPVFATASGQAESDTTVWVGTSVEIPPKTPLDTPFSVPASGRASSDTTVPAGTPAKTTPKMPGDYPFGPASGQAIRSAASPKMALTDPTLQILIGPTVEQSLMDIVLGPAPWCQIESNRITTGLDRSVSDLMASLALQKLIGATREAGGPQAAAIDGRVRSSLSLLISSQNDDGGWSWTGRGAGSQHFGTSRIVWALSLAKAAGYTVPDDTYNKALGYVR